MTGQKSIWNRSGPEELRIDRRGNIAGRHKYH